MEKSLWMKLKMREIIDYEKIKKLAPKVVTGVDKLKKWSETL